MRPRAEGLRLLLSAPRCLLCAGAARELICAGCYDELPWNRLACPRCARPLTAPPARLCSVCAASPPPFDAALAAFRYRAPVDAAIQRLKYHADFVAARWLGAALAGILIRAPQSLPQVLLPVPLHDARLRGRGFNQAQELARVLARSIELRIEPSWARRQRATEDQIGLSAAQRRRNVKGAFTVDARIAGLDVALLDDVMTTGSTLAELAHTCRRAGAARVRLWVVARAE